MRTEAQCAELTEEHAAHWRTLHDEPGLRVGRDSQLLDLCSNHGHGPAAESLAGAHLELVRADPRHMRSDHQLLVRGQPESCQALLYRTGDRETDALHSVQQLEHQRQPAGSVYLGDRRG